MKILPLRLLALVAFLGYRYCNRPATEMQTAMTIPTPTATATAAPAIVRPELGEFIDRQLPNGVTLRIPSNGVENRLIAFIEDKNRMVDKTTWFSFDRLEFESALDLKLRADTLGKSLLFVGHGLGDINIRYLLYKLHKLRARLTAGHQRLPSAYLTAYGAGDVQRRLLAQWDVELIELDPLDKTKSTEAFLESLL